MSFSGQLVCSGFARFFVIVRWQFVHCGDDKTYVPITCLSEKQTAVSHSNTEAEISSLLRQDCESQSYQRSLCGNGSSLSCPSQDVNLGTRILSLSDLNPLSMSHPTLKIPTDVLNCSCLSALRRSLTRSSKGCWSPNTRHISRTHRVDLDWLFKRINVYANMSIRCVNTKNILRTFSFAWTLETRLQSEQGYQKGLKLSVKERPSLLGGKIAVLVDALYGKEHIHIFSLKRCFQHFATVSFVSIVSKLHKKKSNPTSVIKASVARFCACLCWLTYVDGDGCSDGSVDVDGC